MNAHSKLFANPISAHIWMMGIGGTRLRKNYLRHVRVFFRWLVSEGHIEHDPTKKIKLRKVPKKFVKYLMPEELDLLCNAALLEGKSPWMVPLMRLTVQLGLRRSEVVNLRWEWIDLPRRCLTIANTDDFSTKNGEERLLPLSDEASSILENMEAEGESSGFVFELRNGRISPTYVSHRFADIRDRAGLPDRITFHSLRHTCASWLVMNGASLEAVRMFLGHSSIEVTQLYAHLAPSVFAKQITDALR